MPKLTYINNFFNQFGAKEVQSANDIYDIQVEPRFTGTSTKETSEFDALFLDDEVFSAAGDLCKQVRQGIIQFENTVMQKNPIKPYFGANEWEARVEELVYLKCFCVASLETRQDILLSQFIMWMKDEAKTAIIFGSQFNGIVDAVKKINSKVKNNELNVVLTTSVAGDQVKQLTHENADLKKQINLQLAELKSNKSQIAKLIADHKVEMAEQFEKIKSENQSNSLLTRADTLKLIQELKVLKETVATLQHALGGKNANDSHLVELEPATYKK